MDPILFDIKNNIGCITLNRPEKFNAFNREMALLFQNILDRCATDKNIRCVFITGNGKAFSAGQDLAEVVDPNGPSMKQILSEHYNHIILRIRGLKKPVVAAVNGVAAGAAANIALCCDVVLASTSASFIQAFSKIGLIPDSGGTFFLPHLMGIRTPIANPLASGSILGISPTHTALHIYRGLMEGVAYSLYDSYLASGKKAKRLVITGGGAKCTLWREIIANVFNLPVEYYAKSDGALGIAYFTAYSLGEFTDFAPLRYHWLGESATVKPSTALVASYQKSFKKYQELDKKMQDCYQILNLEG